MRTRPEEDLNRRVYLSKEFDVFRCSAVAMSPTEACGRFGDLHVVGRFVDVLEQLLQQAVGEALLGAGHAHAAVGLRILTLPGRGVTLVAHLTMLSVGVQRGNACWEGL